jgi:hypothetical protein
MIARERLSQWQPASCDESCDRHSSMSRRKVQSAYETMTSSEDVTAGDRFEPFHACQEISMVLPRRILRHADVFSLPRLVYAALILPTLFRQNILDLPLSAVRNVRTCEDGVRDVEKHV